MWQVPISISCMQPPTIPLVVWCRGQRAAAGPAILLAFLLVCGSRRRRKAVMLSEALGGLIVTSAWVPLVETPWQGGVGGG